MKKRPKNRPGEVRIIAGAWRGRRLPVVDAPGLRPTPDRVRETLFNWLAPVLPGMRCLDLFAGTGALGIEALSRGAAEACFVESDLRVARSLEESLRRLDTRSGRVVVVDAVRFLAGTPQPFDLVFLDPPFGDARLGDLCTLLGQGWLSGDARVYLEMSREDALPGLPPGWRMLREATAGQVRYALASCPAA